MSSDSEKKEPKPRTATVAFGAEPLAAQPEQTSPSPANLKANATIAYQADRDEASGQKASTPTDDSSVQLIMTPAAVDPRAVAPTIDSVGTQSIVGETIPGTGANHCPVCGALVHNAPECSSCGYLFDDPRLGQVIAERYRVDSLLGVGGFGRVYRGTHLTLGEPVAIKFLLAEWSARTESRARFKREAVALARLRHPSIVAVHDYGEYLDELYMVMELVRGTQLFDRIKVNDQLLPVEQCCRIMDEVLSVLQSAHAMGIIHRDLKAENVMLLDSLEGEVRIKILDFGLALMDDRPQSDRLTALTTIQGTPLYMSPEQCKGRDVTAATDIYAAGILFFELLSGATPFEAPSMPEIMARHMFVEPPPIADWGMKRAVPPGIEAVVRKALAKNADERPTAEQFRALLKEAMLGLDPASLKFKEAQVRAEHAALTRAQRALVDASAQRSTSVHPLPVGEDGTMPRALLWGFEEPRVDALRGPLAVHGVNGVAYKSESAPDALMLEKRPTKLIVVNGTDGNDVLRRVKILRENPPTAKMLILVADLADPSFTPALIRVGASDVAPRSTLDEMLCKQVAKLIRRGR
jgi:serine/threonine-protein kinase